MPRRIALVALPCLPVVGLTVDPLHARLDAVIESAGKGNGVALSDPADGDEFLRRAWRDCDDTSADHRSARCSPGPNATTLLARRYHTVLWGRLGDRPERAKHAEATFAAGDPRATTGRGMPKAEAGRGGGVFPRRAGGVLRPATGRSFGLHPRRGPAVPDEKPAVECDAHPTAKRYRPSHFRALHAFFRHAVLVDAKAVTASVGPTAAKAASASEFALRKLKSGPARRSDVRRRPAPGGVRRPARPPDERPPRAQGRPLAAVAGQPPAAADNDFVRVIANPL